MNAQQKARLPRGVRHYIDRLEADAAHWKAKALAATTPGDSNVCVETIDIAGYPATVGLPPDSRVRFDLGEDAVTIHHGGPQDPDGVIAVHWHGHGYLRVLPATSNVIFLACERPRRKR